jgi:hypothetical protein
VGHYNNVRLNKATGYITPKDMLAGWQREIHAERDRKLKEARKQRRFVASKPLDVQLTAVDVVLLVTGSSAFAACAEPQPPVCRLIRTESAAAVPRDSSSELAPAGPLSSIGALLPSLKGLIWWN